MFAEALQQITETPAYAAGVNWGGARLGHPEGTVKNHIEQLERNLRMISSMLTSEEIEKLRLLIHTHDTFKHQAGENVPVSDPKSHAGLAAEFLGSYISDQDVIAVARHHDAAFASWCDYAYRGDGSCRDLKKAFAEVKNHDLLFTFMLIDGITEGKHMAPLDWAHRVFQVHGSLKRCYNEIMERLAPNSRDYREHSESVQPMVETRSFDSFTYRALGPVEPWGADLTLLSEDRDYLRTSLQALAERTGRRFAGVLTESKGLLHLHLSRYPRRAGEAVPSIKSYRAGLFEAVEALEDAGISVLTSSETFGAIAPGFQRATIGLVEGYAETRKNAVIKMIEDRRITRVAEAQKILREQLGDLGASITSARTLGDLTAKLKALQLATRHSAGEVSAIVGKGVGVEFGEILSVAPGNYLYEEPCVILSGVGRPVRKAAFELATAFKQARFTFESLAARETVNIELPQFCKDPSAK